MTTDPQADLMLDALLAEARSRRPVPSTALMERILADAQALSDAKAPVDPTTAERPSVPSRPGRVAPTGWLRAVHDALGGWAGAGGLAAAAVIGIGLGVIQPDALSGLIWTEAVSVTSGLDDDPLAILGG